MSYATRRFEQSGSAALTTTTSAHNTSTSDLPTSAPVLEFICLFTHDLRQKQKRWQDGKLKYHTFNKRVMVYDERGHFIGDAHWPGDGDLCEGEQLDLDRGGAIVEVSECVGRRDQDLREVLERRGRGVEGRRAAAAERKLPRTPSKPLVQLIPGAAVSGAGQPVLSAARTRTNPHMMHRPLHAVVRSPGPIGRASVPDKSPFEIRQAGQRPVAAEGAIDDRPTKRQRVARSPPAKRQGHAQNLFGTKLTLSATPTSTPLARSHVLQDGTNFQVGLGLGETKEKSAPGMRRNQEDFSGGEESRQSHGGAESAIVAEKQHLSLSAEIRSSKSYSISSMNPPTKRRKRDQAIDPLDTVRNRCVSPGRPPGVEILERLGDEQSSSPPATGHSVTKTQNDESIESRPEEAVASYLDIKGTANRRLESYNAEKTEEYSKRPPTSPVVIPSDGDEVPLDKPATSKSAARPLSTKSAVKPLQKSKRQEKKNREKGKGSATAHDATMAVQQDFATSSPAPPSKDKAKEMARRSARDRGPRAELRIRSRKKRGLLVMSENLPHPTPRASNVVQKLVQIADLEVEAESISRLKGATKDAPQGKRNGESLLASPVMDTECPNKAPQGEVVSNELAVGTLLEGMDSYNIADTNPQSKVEPDHLDVRLASNRVESTNEPCDVPATRESSPHATEQPFVTETEIVEASETSSQIARPSADEASESDVGSHLTTQDLCSGQRPTSSPASEKELKTQSPLSGEARGIEGHGAGDHQLESAESEVDNSSVASRPRRRLTLQRHLPSPKTQNAETSEARVQYPEESNVCDVNEAHQKQPPRMQLKKMGSKSTRCKEIIGWVPRANVHSAVERAKPTALDYQDGRMENPTLDAEGDVAEQSRDWENSDVHEGNMVWRSVGHHDVTNDRAGLQRQDFGMQPDHNHNSKGSPQHDNYENRTSPLAARIDARNYNCTPSRSEEQGLITTPDQALPRTERQNIEVLPGVSGSPLAEVVFGGGNLRPEYHLNSLCGRLDEVDPIQMDDNKDDINQVKQAISTETTSIVDKIVDGIVDGGVKRACSGEEPISPPSPPEHQQSASQSNQPGSHRGIQCGSMAASNGFSWASELPKDVLLNNSATATKGRKGGGDHDPSQRPFSFKPPRQIKPTLTFSERNGKEEPREKRPRTTAKETSAGEGAWSKHAFDLLGINHPRTGK